MKEITFEVQAYHKLTPTYWTWDNIGTFNTLEEATEMANDLRWYPFDMKRIIKREEEVVLVLNKGEEVKR